MTLETVNCDARISATRLCARAQFRGTFFRSRLVMPWICGLAALGTAPADRASGQELSPLVLLANGRTDFNIVVARQSFPVTLLAATELQFFVRRSTGVKLPIVSSVRPNRKTILIRNDPAYPFDGFRIEVKKGDLLITGHDTSGDPTHIDFERPVSCGTLYGVYEFLESMLGVRFYWPDELGTIVPRHDRVEIPRNFNVLQHPHFPLRRLQYGPQYRDDYNEAASDLWGRRLRLGTSTAVRFYHAWRHVINVEEWDKRGHPEYAALRNGKRQTRYDRSTDTIVGQLCTTNEDVISLFADAASKSSDLMFSVSPNDGHTCFCECTACRALDTGERISGGWWAGRRSLSDRIITFYNTIAERSGRKVGGHAYKEYIEVPSRTELHPNVWISIAVNSAYLSADPATRKFTERVFTDWGNYTSRASAYDILYHPWSKSRSMRDLIAPLGEDAVRRVHLISEAGLSGALIYITPQMELGGADAYVVAKLLWNPTLDANKIKDAYYRDLYGRGGESVRELYDLAESRWRWVVAQKRPPEYRTLMIEIAPKLKTLVKQASRLATGQPDVIERLYRLANTVERMRSASLRPDGVRVEKSRGN